MSILYGVILVMLFHLSAAPVRATTRYFATNGTNTNPCTEAAPCLTAKEFEPELQPGDRMLFQRGNTFLGKKFQLLPTRSGTREQPIYYGAYGTGEKPLFHSNDPAMAGDGGADGIRATKVHWVVFEDLAFVGWGSALDLQGTSDIVVRRVSSTGGSSEACLHVFHKDGVPAERVLIEDVELAKCGVNSNGEGIYIGVNPGKTDAGLGTSDITIRRVYIHNRQNDEGIEVKNCVRRVTIEESRIVGSGTSTLGHGIAIAPSSADCPHNNGDHTIRRNIIESNAARGIHLGTGGTITQNILLRNGHPTQSDGIFVEDLPGDNHPVLIQHNAIIENKNAAIQVQDNAKDHTTVQQNLAFGNGAGNSTLPPLPPIPPIPHPPPCCCASCPHK